MIPKRLRTVRKEKKLTQEDLAKLLNTRKQTISNYETGYSSPSNEMLTDIANILNVSTDYLLGRTEKKEQIIVDEDFNPLKKIEEITKKLGLEGFFFQDIEAWKNFTPEDVEELRKHFEWVAHKAKERNNKNET